MAVESTSDDAALSKLSAVRSGYFHDEFLPELVRAAKPPRRAPLINRGYYARVSAFELVLRKFFGAQPAICAGSEVRACNVIALGAGLDSAFFRMVSAGLIPRSWLDVDLPVVTAAKARAVERSDKLRAVLRRACEARAEVDGAETPPSLRIAAEATDLYPAGASVAAGVYNLRTVDIRDAEAMNAACAEVGMDVSLPTLLVSECVLVYLLPDESDAVISWAAKTFEHAAIMCYEQVRPHDAFGQMMIQHLQARGAPLHGLKKYASCEAHERRYLACGWDAVTARDMNDVYYKQLPREAVEAAEKVELFDELEEWWLMMSHYQTSVAVKGKPELHALLWQ